MKTELRTPSLRRRLTSMIYESMLVFGILFTAGLIFDLITQSKDWQNYRLGRQVWFFFVLGFYFIYCWCRSGQTLAMQTWRIRVVDVDGQKLPLVKGVVRYLFAWLWFLPALGLIEQLKLHHWQSVIVLFVGISAWALTAKLGGDGQFLHDHFAKTRLIEVPLKKANKDETERETSEPKTDTK